MEISKNMKNNESMARKNMYASSLGSSCAT